MSSGYAIATLVVFIISIFFVIRPVSIPTPGPLPRIPINLTTAPILAIAVLWAAQCLDSTVVRNGIVGTEGVKPYNILILFFSLAYMAITLDITGILQAAAFWVSNKGGRNGRRLYLYFYVMLTLLSILLGNDPVILSGTAFLVYYTDVAKLQPNPWTMAEFAAANTASMVLFVGNPTNVVICEGFNVNNAAFTAYTILPFVACNIFCFFTLALQYRKHVPPELSSVAQQDPRSVLHDPIGAWVGSFMLGATLVLCLVVSFFGIDVWMISLPFAFGKFIFDLGWDHYRYPRRMRMLCHASSKPIERRVDAGSAVRQHQQAADNLLHNPLSDVERSRSLQTDEPTVVESQTHDVNIKAMKGRVDASFLAEKHHTEDRRSPDPSYDVECSGSLQSDGTTAVGLQTQTPKIKAAEGGLDTVFLAEKHYMDDGRTRHPPPPYAATHSSPTNKVIHSKMQPRPLQLVVKILDAFRWSRSYLDDLRDPLYNHFPTLFTALPRLPFALVPFAFSQFILIEALNHQGWVKVFAGWLIQASHKQVHPTIWLIGVLGVILCNLSGTNIGATILLTQVVRAAALPYDANRAAAIALTVASNIGAVSFTFSASLAGLLWRAILGQKGVHIRQRDFAFWNLLPLLVMTTVGLGVVSAEMAVLFQP